MKGRVLADILILAFFGLLYAGVTYASADGDAVNEPAELQAKTAKLKSKVAQHIQKSFLDCRVEIDGPVHWTAKLPKNWNAFKFMNVTGKGEAHFQVGLTTAKVRFRAFKWVYVAKSRIRPGTRLTEELVEKKEVDVSSGFNSQYRAMMLGAKEKIEELETKQTILEGHVALSTGLKKVPDVRRGQNVRVKIKSGLLSITTSGAAQKDALAGDILRVQLRKTKKMLVGKLSKDGSIEVDI